MRSILIIFFLMLIAVSAKSQKWQTGAFTDVKGNRVTGFLNPYPAGKGPIKDEAFIEFKDDEKTSPYKLSASDLKSFIVGKDSFVVAHAPHNTTWSKKELDFVKVELDEETKLYVAVAGTYYGGKSRGISAHPEGGVGIGTGGYSGVGGGVGIDLGGGGGAMGKAQLTYYYGGNTAEMSMVTPQNFEDVMSDIMGDIPELLERIRDHQFNLGNIQKLIAYFKQAKASAVSSSGSGQ
ncbi:MAG TPA: hypothetical protein VG367_14935 [Mucilaginibacter sp.]|jgi:hypothetical protein|nr:hypothetical protein [Mucilaginibacter sp.]